MRHSVAPHRFAVVHGTTPYELVYNKVCKVSYMHTSHKRKGKWQRVIVLGKTESQDSCVVFRGKSVMACGSVSRIATNWKNHLSL